MLARIEPVRRRDHVMRRQQAHQMRRPVAFQGLVKAGEGRDEDRDMGYFSTYCGTSL